MRAHGFGAQVWSTVEYDVEMSEGKEESVEGYEEEEMEGKEVDCLKTEEA